jgi:hypothetical protein
MLSESSPLRELPEGLERRQVLFFDALAVSMQMTERGYRWLQGSLEQHTLGDSGDDMTGDVLMSAWSVVDTLNRVRVLVAAMPGLKQSAPAVQIFLREVEEIEQLRNAIQHMYGEITRISDSADPIWGGLVWLTPHPTSQNQVLSNVFVPGHLAVGASVELVNPVGKVIRSPVDHVHLVAAGTRVSLSAMHDATVRFAGRLEKAAAQAFASAGSHAGESWRATLVPQAD